MLYPRHLLGESYLSAKMQSLYATAPADWAVLIKGTLAKSSTLKISGQNTA